MIQNGLPIFCPSVTKLCYVEFSSLSALSSLLRGGFLHSETKMLVLEGKTLILKKNKVKQVSIRHKNHVLKQCDFFMQNSGIFRMFLSFRKFLNVVL